MREKKKNAKYCSKQGRTSTQTNKMSNTATEEMRHWLWRAVNERSMIDGSLAGANRYRLRIVGSKVGPREILYRRKGACNARVEQRSFRLCTFEMDIDRSYSRFVRARMSSCMRGNVRASRKVKRDTSRLKTCFTLSQDP